MCCFNLPRSRSRTFLRAAAAFAFLFACAVPASSQFRSFETEDLRLVYFGPASDYLVGYTARAFTNSLAFHRERFTFEPSDRITVMLHDQSDYGNAGADVLPRNRIVMAMAPLSYSFETSPANERINATLHHELMHIVVNDQSAARDRFFRGLFGGKVAVDPEDPATILYSYATAPRRYAPRWYQEGVAVFMETWMAGGLGRSLAGYDEMFFRALALENAEIYDLVGLESAGTAIDFQVGVNSYLYGTRFMSYLAYTYGPQKVLDWVNRRDGTKGHFTAAFRATFGKGISEGWNDWIAFEREHQAQNLARIREAPVTQARSIAPVALGSVSRTHLSLDGRTLYAAVNFPGQIAHVAAIDVVSGAMRRVADVKGPTLYSVASTTYDANENRLFITTDNGAWRDLVQVDLDRGTSRVLLKDARVGDLAFNPVDRSIWGVRHDLGFSTVVRIDAPYTRWRQVHTLEYGTDLYDLDVSPDGAHLTGSFADVTGEQTLVRYRIDDLLAGRTEAETLFDFSVSNPEAFTFSADGRYLYGSSYFSGASNIYRYDLAEERMAILTNAETGFFRPVPVSADSMLALRFGARGFQPVMLPIVSASARSVTLLGQRVVDRHPVVRDWVAGSPADVDLEALESTDRPYRPLTAVGLGSVYPIVQGYKDNVAVGVRLNFSDPVGLHALGVSLSYDPDTSLPQDERIHASMSYRHLGWTVDASLNRASFYDLFGPTKTSRKGYAAGIRYNDYLVYDRPRTLQYTVGLNGYADLERLPDYQNVVATYTEMASGFVSLAFENLRGSIGSVDREKGVAWELKGSATYVNREVHPRFLAEYHWGVPLPVKHTSLWLRASGGHAVGDRTNPFVNFYFGGFGNNWIDHQAERRYAEFYAFPGLPLNAVGGKNFVRGLVDLNLPPVRFRRLGGSSFYARWLRLTGFAGGLVTNLDDDATRVRAVTLGGQLDLRIVFFSYLKTTLSAGYGTARILDGGSDREFMVSLKVL